MKKFILPIILFAFLAIGGGLAIPFLKKGDANMIGSNLSLKVDVPPPSEHAVGEKDFPDAEQSTLALRIELPVSALAAAAAQKIPKEFTGTEKQDFHQRIKNGNVQYRIVPDPLALENTGNHIAFKLPLRGGALVTGDFEMLIRIPIQGDVEFGGNVLGTLRPEIDNNWKLMPNLDANINISQATLTLRRLGAIDITDTIQGVASPLVQKETAALANGFELKSEAQKLWDGAHLNQQISDNPPAWILIDPYDVSMGPVDYSNPQVLTLTMAVNSVSKVSNAPSNVAYPENIPELKQLQSNPSTLVRIPVIADLGELNRLIAAQIVERSGIAGSSITITQPEMRMGSEGFMLIGFNINADSGKIGRKMEGKIWLKAKPMLDYETQMLEFTDFQFTKETLEALPATATKLLNSQLLGTLAKELKIDLNEHLPKLEEELHKQLNSQKLPDGVQLIAEKPDVKLHSLYTVTRPSQDANPAPAVVIVLEATGALTARLSALP